MEEGDLDEVLTIEAASRQTSWSQQSFAEEMKNPLSSCFLLKRKKSPRGQVLGFICFRVIGKESELLNLAVRSRYRQMGLGRQLMRFYFDFCHEKKVRAFYLETGISNQPALRLYQSLGYQIEGVRSKFYPGNEDALLMVRRASPDEGLRPGL